MTVTFPILTQRLHRVAFIDYQLQRFAGCGFARAEVMAEALRGRRRFVDVAEGLAQLSREAEAAGELRAATAYQRGVELFTPAQRPARREAYDRHQRLFALAFADEGWTRHEVPFGAATLPAYLLPARGQEIGRSQGGARGTVLLHGGFDSLIEEFVGIWIRIAEAGFDVVAFEGPGQGGARLVGGLTFDHDWERPVAAVLDHFALERADLVGVSMGGWWALRAAAFEPRIERVVSWPPVYDWLAKLPSFAAGLVQWMVRFRRVMNPLIRLRMRLFPVLDHAVRHATFLVDGREPMDAVDWLMAMNAEALQSHRVRQDVLLMVGEDDDFQSPRLADAQQAALTAARSVTRRDFTRAENAGRHCQMNNLGLACDVLTDWLREGPARP